MLHFQEAAIVILSSILQFALLAAGVTLTYGISKSIYNLFFHPLRHFPGPKYAAFSNLFYAYYWPSGRWPFVLEELHRKYGPVVRYAPNDLDFATVQSYQDIHGHTKPPKPIFLKSSFYKPDIRMVPGIVSIIDPIKHRQVRRGLSHAFSAKALRTQTDVVQKFVDLFVKQVKRYGDTEEGINVEEWWNWLTFDIIGDLAFGEAFGSVEKVEGHPWVVTIKDSLHAAVFLDVFRRISILRWFPWLVRNERLQKARGKVLVLSKELTERRIRKGGEEGDGGRVDFFSKMLSEKSVDTSLPFLTAQSNTLIVAGSETTATFLTGATYFLLSNPRTYQRLCHEVRTAFKTSSEIDGDSTQKLPYLFSVIEEGLRLFPPVPSGLHRVSPGAPVDGHYVPPGVSVSTSYWSTSHSPQYFHDARGFHPERWLQEGHEWWEERFKGDEKDASKPFGLGPRACLGINLAYLEMRIVLARMVWEFEWEKCWGEELDWERDLELRVLWKKPKLMVRFMPVVRG